MKIEMDEETSETIQTLIIIAGIVIVVIVLFGCAHTPAPVCPPDIEGIAVDRRSPILRVGGVYHDAVATPKYCAWFFRKDVPRYSPYYEFMKQHENEHLTSGYLGHAPGGE